MADSMRFILASDLMLGRPLRGLTDWPSEMADDLVDAPYHSAKRIFDHALESSSRFILLAGNVLDLRTSSPRSLRFLFDECQRVAKRGIEVVWFEGKYDRFEDWPTGVVTPDNLTCVPRQSISPVEINGGKGPEAKLFNIGVEAGTDQEALDDYAEAHVEPSATQPFLVGVASQGRVPEIDADDVLDFVALGGRSTYHEHSVDGVPVICAGTHQPRRPGKESTGGLVEVLLRPDKTTHRRVTTSFVRFVEESQEFIAAPTLESLKERIGERCLDLASSIGDDIGIIRWLVDVPSADYAGLDVHGLERDLIAWLRKEFCKQSHRLWSYRVEFRAEGATPTSWMEEDSILGDFLRALRDYEDNDDRQFAFEDFIHGEAKQVRELLDRELDESNRERLLERVREVGFNMLRG